MAESRAAPKGQHLDPAAVLSSIAALVRPYGVRRVLSDMFHGESLAAIAERMNLGISVVVDKPTQSERLARYEGTLTRFLDDALELPRDAHVRADMIAVRRRVTAGANAFTISMAVTADGRHADYAPSIVLALSRIRGTSQRRSGRRSCVKTARRSSGAVSRHDETTEALLEFTDLLEQVLAEEAKSGGAA